MLDEHKKIKIAFVKYGGLTSGGSEKLLQIIAANLPKDRFEVTFFYSKLASNHEIHKSINSVEEKRKLYLTKRGVTLREFSVKSIDFSVPFYTWEGTNFFTIFNENDFDIIQTCRAGRKEYPFTAIKNKPIVDIIALSSGVDNQFNVSRVIHLSHWSAKLWVGKGGDKSRIRFMSLPIDLEGIGEGNLRGKYNIGGYFVFGFHQRPSDDIFSDIPLNAYSKVASEKTMFILLGGSHRYKQQAESLKLKNIIFIPFSADVKTIFSFLRTLDVYCHGRKDGEINSQAIAEALSQNLPVISHYSEFNNGQVEGIGNAGRVVMTTEEYADEMNRMIKDQEYFEAKKEEAKKRFENAYSLKQQVKRYTELYLDVIKSPFPNVLRRRLYSLHYTQNIRIIMIWLYLKLKNLSLFFKK